MKQILHIFMKDTRRFWPEILISLAMAAALVFIYPNQWVPAIFRFHRGISNIFGVPGVMQFLAEALMVLVPLSWWLLITRLIQAERLVGSTQFWLTRPYEWKKLMAAKLLFVLVFLYLPLLIAQCLLLAEAGFHPFAFMPGLLYNLMLLNGVLVLPLLALSAVTSSFARMTLTLLGVLLGVAIFAAIVSSLASQKAVVPHVPGDQIPFVLLLCGCAAAMVLQYARRKTWLARALLAAVPVLLMSGLLIMPENAMMNRAYPPHAGEAVPVVQFTSNPESQKHAIAYVGERADQIRISLPVMLSGLADSSVVIPENVRATIEAPDGSKWTSLWQPEFARKYMPGEKETSVGFAMPRALYDKYRSSPVKLSITFALSQAKIANVTPIVLPSSDFAVPEFGVCTPEISPFDPLQVFGVDCRAAMHQPALTFVSVRWSGIRCGLGQTAPDEGPLGTDWVGSLDNDPADLGIASVWNVPVRFTNDWNGSSDERRGPRYLCQGAQATFTRYRLTQRTQMELTVPEFTLPKLAVMSIRLEAR